MADGGFIAKRDVEDFKLLMQEFRAVGRTLRKPPPPRELRPTHRPSSWIGLADSAFTKGPLNTGSDPEEHSVTVINAPTDHPDHETFGKVYPDFCLRDCEAGQHVLVQQFVSGMRGVAPAFCDDDEPA